MKPRPTLRDIAVLLGSLHPSTVSRALHGDVSISVSTRREVLKAAAKLGYRPDPMLDAFNQHRNALRSQRLNEVIALLAPSAASATFPSLPPLQAFLGALTRAAAARSCKCEMFPVGPDFLRAERLEQVLLSRGIRCILVLDCALMDPLDSFRWSNFYCVKLAGRHLKRPRRLIVDDLREASYRCTSFLITTGRQRPALDLATDTSPDDRNHILAGYLGACSNFGLQPYLRSDSAQKARLTTWLKRGSSNAFVSNQGSSVIEAAARGLACLSLQYLPPQTPLGGGYSNFEVIATTALDQLLGLVKSGANKLESSDYTVLVPMLWQAPAWAESTP